MNDLTHLLRSIAKLGAIVVVMVSGIVSTPLAYDNYRAYPDKTKRLYEVAGGRVIAVGGSGTAFGVESKMLSVAVGKPVLNMGLHAGLGLDFMLRHVLPGVRAGDLVIVIPEYGILADDAVTDEGVVAGVLLADPRAFYPYWQSSDIAPMARGFSDLALHRLFIDPVIELRRRYLTHELKFDRSSFDANGDIDIPEDVPRRTEPWKMMIHSQATVAIERLNAFNAAVRARGARTLFVYSSIPRAVASANAKALTDLDQEIEAHLDMPQVGRPEEAVQPDENFFDTPNHPNRHGRIVETERIIASLHQVGALPDN